MLHRPNLGVWILRTISNIFALVLDKKINATNMEVGKINFTEN